MNAKQMTLTGLLIGGFLLLGYGIGSIYSKTMKKDEGSGYIGPQQVEIKDGVMTPEVLLALGRISDPQLSPDGSRILYGISYQSIKENRSCRNLFLCNPDGSGRVQLTKYAKSVSCARWSGDGKSIYFVQGGQLWNAPLKGSRLGKKVQLSDVPAGIGEFKIAPDGKQIIYTSTVKNKALVQPADTDSALDKAQAYSTEDLMYRHWDHWVTEVPRSYVAPLGKDKITPANSVDILGTDELFELPTEPFGGVEQLDWAPDSRHIAYSCRKKVGKQYAFSTNTSIYIYNVETGRTIDVKVDGGYDTDPVWSPDGKHLAWVSMPRDGYEADQQRLLVADIDLETESVSNVRRLGNDFDYDVNSPVWHGDRIYFSALVKEAVQSIFVADLEGNIERLTPGDWWTDFFTPFAILDKEDGSQELLTSFYSLEFPVELVSVVPGENPVCSQITTENSAILGQLSPIHEESVYVETVDHKQMQCWVVYPPEFDVSKVYPAIEIVLGGPQSSNSQDWSYRWCYRLMAQQGYIVILPNRRGTTAFGQEWKEEISGDYPGLNMQDYLSAGRYIKSKPYVGKLACVGASYGGYSAYMLEGLHGDLYDCFIAHAGIFDEKQLWYTTEEMWFANWDNGGLREYAFTPGELGPRGDGITFGGMQQAGSPYASTPKAKRHYGSSPSSMVTKWHTPILCIHGGMDFRIPVEQGMAAFNAAQMMGVPSKLIVFPEETHWVLQPQNALFWHRNFYDWLDRWCK
ncbi:MAG: S9 family peptidase [Bacteroidales bacterium]|nr:S9 family peptidase [Bacteroidales bacterium]